MQRHINSGKEHRSVNQKKADYMKRVEEDQKGNPLLKPQPVINIPMTEQQKENLKLQDQFGNPLPGYKWAKRKGVPVIVKIKLRKFDI